MGNGFRFPGQYYDSETGLHYNYHRYYNPATGRYLTPDPIGLAGMDPNLYGYVLNNPVNAIDPEGKIIRRIIDLFRYGKKINKWVEIQEKIRRRQEEIDKNLKCLDSSDPEYVRLIQERLMWSQLFTAITRQSLSDVSEFTQALSGIGTSMSGPVPLNPTDVVSQEILDEIGNLLKTGKNK